MKCLLRYAVLCLILFTAFLVDLFPQQPTAAKPRRGWLTVDTIMRDSRWMGISPGRPFWSEDGESLYFTWGQGGDGSLRLRGEPDSLFVVSAKGGAPRAVSLEERKRLPARSGAYSKDWSKKLYSKGGDIFLLDIRANRELQLTSTISAESNPRFLLNEQRIVFERSGNLFVRDLKTATESQITNIQSAGGAQESPRSAGESRLTGFQGGAARDASRTDAPKLLEKQQMELFDVLRDRKAERDARKKLQDLLEIKHAKQYNPGQKVVSMLLLSPDERFVTFALYQAATDVKRTIVPAYVTESGYTEDIPARSKVGEPASAIEFCVYNVALDSVMPVKTEGIPGIMSAPTARDTSRAHLRPRPVSFSGPYWSDEGKLAFVQIFSNDHKDRWIVMLDPEKAKFTTVLDHQHHDAWIGGPGVRGFGFASATVGWLADSRRIYFQSEEDGWSHLYTVTTDGRIKVQLTKGAFEIYNPQLSRDKKRWYFSSNEIHYGERHFYSMPLEGGQRTRVTSMEGRSDVTLSPSESRAAILYSFSNKMPELYLMDNKPAAKAVRVTSSASTEFNSYDWRAPEVLTFKARDGADVPVRLYKPEQPNGAAVIFVHGAGYLQNAHRWWSEYYHEYMFNNLLTDKGYTVLDMDYRASAGLGRDWRTAVYRHMGGKDLDDHVDGAGWLVQNHGISPKRIGLYGGSYGGFITLMALFTAPDVFAAGAALRPVSDWAHYNQGYTSEILNIPQEDTLAYRQSSPIYFAEGLKGALLVCHGMVDENVHFQDAVRLVQRLIELRKENWELAVYPVEDHGFREPSSWADEYKRILKLFDTNLLAR